MVAEEDRFGPVNHVVVQFERGHIEPSGFTRLLGLVDAGIIRVLDLEFVVNEGGTVRTVDASELEGVDLEAFAGASSALLDRTDIDLVGSRLEADHIAAVLVYEELSLLPVLAAWEGAGGSVLSEGPVDVSDIDETLALEDAVQS